MAAKKLRPVGEGRKPGCWVSLLLHNVYGLFQLNARINTAFKFNHCLVFVIKPRPDKYSLDHTKSFSSLVLLASASARA